MKRLILSSAALIPLLISSCTPPTTAPLGNVEDLERQSPVTADPNSIGNAINAGNAVNYSNGGGRGRAVGPLLGIGQ